jgi:hypothetical protein
METETETDIYKNLLIFFKYVYKQNLLSKKFENSTNIEKNIAKSIHNTIDLYKQIKLTEKSVNSIKCPNYDKYITIIKNIFGNKYTYKKNTVSTYKYSNTSQKINYSNILNKYTSLPEADKTISNEATPSELFNPFNPCILNISKQTSVNLQLALTNRYVDAYKAKPSLTEKEIETLHKLSYLSYILHTKASKQIQNKTLNVLTIKQINRIINKVIKGQKTQINKVIKGQKTQINEYINRERTKYNTKASKNANKLVNYAKTSLNANKKAAEKAAEKAAQKAAQNAESLPPVPPPYKNTEKPILSKKLSKHIITSKHISDDTLFNTLYLQIKDYKQKSQDSQKFKIDNDLYYINMHGKFNYNNGFIKIPENIVLVFLTPVNRFGVFCSYENRNNIYDIFNDKIQKNNILNNIFCIDKINDTPKQNNANFLSDFSFFENSIVLLPGQYYFDLNISYT